VPVVEPAAHLPQFWRIRLELEEAEDGEEESTAAAALPGVGHRQATAANCSAITRSCVSSAEAICPLCIEAICRTLGALELRAMS